jgi:hypothetical protein
MINKLEVKEKNNDYTICVIGKNVNAEEKIKILINEIIDNNPEFKCFKNLNSNNEIVSIVLKNGKKLLDLVRCIEKKLSDQELIVGLKYMISIFESVIQHNNIPSEEKIKLFDSIGYNMYNHEKKSCSMAAECCLRIVEKKYNDLALILRRLAMLLIYEKNEEIIIRYEYVLEKFMPYIRKKLLYEFKDIVYILKVKYDYINII